MNTTIGKVNVAQLRAKEEAKFTALVNGINSQLGDVTTFALGDQMIPKAQVVSRLQARIDAAEKTKSARLALHAAVAAEALIVADTTPLVVDLKAYVQGRYGKNSPKNQLFGFTQAKVPQRTAVNTAQGVVKARNTRKAVGPTGKKQRKAAAKAIAATATVQAPATTPAPAPAAAPITGTPVTNGGK